MDDDALAVYFVRGDDPSLVMSGLASLVAHLVGDEDSGLVVEDLGVEDVDVSAILDACATPAFLTTKRVVIARDAGRFRAADVVRLIAYLQDPLESTSLILVSGGGQASTKLLDAVRTRGAIVDTSVGTGKARTQWLADRLKGAPVKLDVAAKNALGNHVGEDLGRIDNLLQALATAYGAGATVGLDELAPFLGEAGGVAPWDLTDAVDRGDTAQALEYLHRLMHGSDRHPLVVIATLQRHVGAMLKLDGADATDEKHAAAITGMSPYPAKKALAQARRLGHVGVARAVHLLAEADLDLRGKRAWSAELVMEVLVARLSKLTKGGSVRADRA